MFPHPGQVIIPKLGQRPQRVGSRVVAEIGSLLAGAMAFSPSPSWMKLGSSRGRRPVIFEPVFAAIELSLRTRWNYTRRVPILVCVSKTDYEGSA
jgi:hypothetical protein